MKTASENIFNPPATNAQQPRLLLLDALRGVVMFVMLFVNDIPGVRGLPAWMKHHEPSHASGMTFVDWVFGGFLFIVGMSIPPALAARRARGESITRIALHILTRSAALLLLGVMMVNGDASAARTFYPPNLWATLLYLFGIAAFVSHRIVRIIGFTGLAFLAVTFRNETGGYLRPQWWGILGLLGWAYLITAFICMAFRGNRIALAIAIPVLMSLFYLDQAGAFARLSLDRYIDLGTMLGSHAAIAASGALLGAAILAPSSRRRQIVFAIFFAAALFIAAAITYPHYGINKNAATPAWCFICAAITALLWTILAMLIDVAHVTRPLHLFIRGGQNVLLAYLLHPLWLHLLALCGLTFYARLGNLAVFVGIARSLLLATVILWLAGALKDRGVRLKL